MANTRNRMQHLSAIVLFAVAFAPTSAFALSWQEIAVSGGDSSSFSNSTWLCALTGVQGSFSNSSVGTQQVFVTLQDDDTWLLHAGGTRTGRMACTRWSNFTAPQGGVMWVDNSWSLAINDAIVGISTSVNVWQGDAASAISWMGGEFEGSGESITITQSLTPTGYNKFTLATGVGNHTNIEGAVINVFVGNPDFHQMLRLIGYNSNGTKVRADASTKGSFEMAVSTQSGFNTYWLADTSGANGGLCYFTRLSGNFNANNESAIITEISNTWQLKVTHGSGSAYARARCMAYDQR